MRIWLDDKRPMPEGFDIHMSDAFSVIDAIKGGNVTKISLDHDLGQENEVGNGYMVAKIIEELAFYGTIQRIQWAIHSQNSVGIASMRKALERADQYWENYGY